MDLSKRFTLGLALFAVGGLVLAGLAPAPVQARRSARFRKQFLLLPTPAGAQVGLTGKAVVEARPDEGREKVKVEVQSRVLSEGTILNAYAINLSNSTNPVLLGSLTVTRRTPGNRKVSGELEVKNYDGGTLPEGLSPVPGITRIFVTTPGDSATELLRSNRNPNTGGGGGGGEVITPLRRRVNLVPTAAGTSAGASGKAEIETRVDRRQRFKIEVEASSLPAGTVVDLRFSTAGGTYSAGTLTLQPVGNGVEAEVEFDNREGTPLPTNADPVNAILSVTVSLRDTGETILTGTF